MDFGDILKDLDFGAMAIAEARYDRYSLFTDILYTKISAVAGYRALGVDYSHDGFVLDIVQQGPICGVVMHF
jgi:hypothetical protein